MEISQSSIGIFHLSRILGLAPYCVRRDNKGRLNVRRNIFLTIYSTALVLVLAFLTYNGLLFDANSKIPIRMKSATSKVVTSLDVSVVVFTTLAGLVCSIVGLHHTRDLNKRLKEADDTLLLYTDEGKDRKRGYALMTSVIVGITTMLGLDIWSWYRVAKTMIADEDESPKLNVKWYIPFYGLYYILMGLHIHFAHSAVGLGRRYRRLNIALKNSFLEDIKPSGAYHKDTNPGLIRVSTINVNNGKSVDNNLSCPTLTPAMIATMTTTNHKKMLTHKRIINDGRGVTEGRQLTVYSPTRQHILERLAYTHESLGKAMGNISGAFGFAVLLMLTSCLLHLVATSYFLFLEMLIKGNMMVTWLQALWLLFHILRLLLIVEPCHITSVEAKQTLMIVCEIQRNCKDEYISGRMEKFWQQLIGSNANFSACGMCTIDRQILTSFSGAIATYLVILIQFQKTDG